MTAIAIFVKTPGLSPVKTRLAAVSGQAWAERWHAKAAWAVAEAASAAAAGPVYWAVAESQAEARACWTELPVLEQGNGGLGDRMSRVMDSLVHLHGSALLLGADAPQVSPACLEQAAAWLSAPDPRLCLGPARDGGFWTFGANRAPDRKRWTSVRYSQHSTSTDFRQAMQDLGQWLTLPSLTDLDRAEDLAAVINELAAMNQPQPRQRALLAWLRQQALSANADTASIQKC